MQHDGSVTDQTLPETVPAAPVPEVVQPDSAPQPVAESAPEEVVVTAAETPAASEPAAAAAEVAAPRRKAAPRPQVSDDTLEAWQARLAAKQAAKERAERQQRAGVESRRARAEAFRVLRQALQQTPAETEIDPELQALADDALARQVHQAPAHVREVLAATLALMAGKRRGGASRR